jgi:hypothetical protein
MFHRKPIFAVMLVGALLGATTLAPAQAAAAHSCTIGPLPARLAALSERRRGARRSRTTVSKIVRRVGVRLHGPARIRPGRKAVLSRRPLLDSFARGPPRPQGY